MMIGSHKRQAWIIKHGKTVVERVNGVELWTNYDSVRQSATML